jgi:hypothetical protein
MFKSHLQSFDSIQRPFFDASTKPQSRSRNYHNAPFPPKAMNGSQHLDDRKIVPLAPKTGDHQDEWQRNEPDHGKKNDPPEQRK